MKRTTKRDLVADDLVAGELYVGNDNVLGFIVNVERDEKRIKLVIFVWGRVLSTLIDADTRVGWKKIK